MKKTLIINIGNSIIHIEEDAYEILTAYLNEIKAHFAKSADDFEIVTDIENRIAEMLNELLQGEQKPVIEISDVENVIGQMGRVQDFEVEEGEDVASAKATGQEFVGDKKLFRDTEEGVIAGVCAGLGHYLNIEGRWIRLIMFLAVLLAGSGVIAYLILWIAMPKAITRAQRMEMKGEATNLYGYKRSFEEELQAFRRNMQGAGDTFKPLAKQSGNFITASFRTIGRLIQEIVKISVKTIAVFMMILAFCSIVCLVICAAALMGFWSQNPFDSFPFSVVDESYRGIVIFWAFITVFIPLFALMLFSIRVAFNRKTINKTVSFTLLIIWLLGVGGTGYYTTKMLSEFQEHAELVKNIDVKPYKTIYIDADDRLGLSKEDSVQMHIDDKDMDGRVVVDDFDNHPFRTPRRIRFRIEKADDARYLMIQTFESQGKTFKDALENAQNIKYEYSHKDSLITLSPRLQFKQKTKWRNQELRITLKLPVGARVMINDNVYNTINFNYYGCDAEDDTKSKYKEWVMTEDGLKCVAEIRQKAIKIRELKDELAKLEILQTVKETDTLSQDSITTRIEEIKGVLDSEAQ